MPVRFSSLSASGHKRASVCSTLPATHRMHSPFHRLNFHCLHSHVRYFGRANLTNRTSFSYFCETRRASKKEKRTALQALMILPAYFFLFISVAQRFYKNRTKTKISIFIGNIYTANIEKRLYRSRLGFPGRTYNL